MIIFIHRKAKRLAFHLSFEEVATGKVILTYFIVMLATCIEFIVVVEAVAIGSSNGGVNILPEYQYVSDKFLF